MAFAQRRMCIIMGRIKLMCVMITHDATIVEQPTTCHSIKRYGQRLDHDRVRNDGSQLSTPCKTAQSLDIAHVAHRHLCRVCVGHMCGSCASRVSRYTPTHTRDWHPSHALCARTRLHSTYTSAMADGMPNFACADQSIYKTLSGL